MDQNRPRLDMVAVLVAVGGNDLRCRRLLRILKNDDAVLPHPRTRNISIRVDNCLRFLKSSFEAVGSAAWRLQHLLACLIHARNLIRQQEAREVR